MRKANPVSHASESMKKESSDMSMLGHYGDLLVSSCSTSVLQTAEVQGIPHALFCIALHAGEPIYDVGAMRGVYLLPAPNFKFLTESRM